MAPGILYILYIILYILEPIIILSNTIDRLARRFDLIKVENLLIFHKDKVEGAVEDCVDEVCQTQIEDEDVCDSPHLLVF